MDRSPSTWTTLIDKVRNLFGTSRLFCRPLAAWIAVALRRTVILIQILVEIPNLWEKTHHSSRARDKASNMEVIALQPMVIDESWVASDSNRGPIG